MAILGELNDEKRFIYFLHVNYLWDASTTKITDYQLFKVDILISFQIHFLETVRSHYRYFSTTETTHYHQFLAFSDDHGTVLTIILICMMHATRHTHCVWHRPIPRYSPIFISVLGCSNAPKNKSLPHISPFNLLASDKITSK